MPKPLCFVLMPFGKKPAGNSGLIDFDAVYHQIIAPAVAAVGLEPLRADEEDAGGIIHKPMFERLVLCDFAIADLTTANANVFYELGVRHAAKPRSTVLLFAEGEGRLPFDVAQLRALPYDIDRNGLPSKVPESVTALTEKLRAARYGEDKDSPVYQLLDNYPIISHEKTDVFRERVDYAAKMKSQLDAARRLGTIEAVRQVESELGNLADQEAGVVIDLFLSYRAVSAWDEMVRVEQLFNPVISRTVLVREQLALALNRSLNDKEAESVLHRLIEERGQSPETLGILGRVYKDRWARAKQDGHASAPGHLRQAIRAYTSGFEIDWRDAYPGINAITLNVVQDPDSQAAKDLIPVVRYSLERRMKAREADFWDYATKLELEVLGRDDQAASSTLADCLAHLREKWEAETSANNLRMIEQAYRDANIEATWLRGIIAELESVAAT